MSTPQQERKVYAPDGTNKCEESEQADSTRSLPKAIAGAMVFSGMVTGMMLISSLFASGTWLDPRVWTGSYVAGDQMASRMDNASWVIDSAVNAAPWFFLGFWGCLVALLLISRKFTKA